jgi:hypothetical protein
VEVISKDGAPVGKASRYLVLRDPSIYLELYQNSTNNCTPAETSQSQTRFPVPQLAARRERFPTAILPRAHARSFQSDGSDWEATVTAKNIAAIDTACSEEALPACIMAAL